MNTLYNLTKKIYERHIKLRNIIQEKKELHNLFHKFITSLLGKKKKKVKKMDEAVKGREVSFG